MYDVGALWLWDDTHTCFGRGLAVAGLVCVMYDVGASNNSSVAQRNASGSLVYRTDSRWDPVGQGLLAAGLVIAVVCYAFCRECTTERL